MFRSALVLPAALSILSLSTAQAQIINLAGQADPTSFMAEYDITGVQAQINFGDGTAGDADGLYNVADLSQSFGSADVFPRESNFSIGSLSYNDGAITGSGVETSAVTGLDLSGFWTADPNRDGSGGATVTSDISDHALGLWFFNAPGSIGFGALDAADTVTFTDGVLTSIDLSVSASFIVDYTFAGSSTSYDGSFSISGADFAFQIDETELNVPTSIGSSPQSRFVADVSGTINAVPEPASALIVLGGGMGLLARRKQA